MYLAVLLDLASRRVVGWAAADHMRDELTLEALDAALHRRGGQADLTKLIHHSDRGSQYASDDYIAALEVRGSRLRRIQPSSVQRWGGTHASN